MGQEHAPEIVWQAQELYCSDRLSFVRVAELVGVADSTLRRWADAYGWREKREEIAKAEADIRADKVLARAKALKTFLDKPRAEMGFAISSLETLAMKEAEVSRQQTVANIKPQEVESIAINTPAEAIAALRKAVEQKLATLLTRPEAVNLKAVQEVQKCLSLIGTMEAAQPVADKDSTGKGLSADLVARFEAAMRGDL